MEPKYFSETNLHYRTNLRYKANLLAHTVSMLKSNSHFYKETNGIQMNHIKSSNFAAC